MSKKSVSVNSRPEKLGFRFSQQPQYSVVRKIVLKLIRLTPSHKSKEIGKNQVAKNDNNPIFVLNQKVNYYDEKSIHKKNRY